MPIGTVARRALGRFEPAAIKAYRGVFIDLEAVATAIAPVVPLATRVLEIGCGDGAMAAALRRALPTPAIIGLDPGVAEPGRMFDAEPTDVEFRRATTTELISEHPEPFDLVLLVDVLHHVAEEQREQILRDAEALTAPGGVIALKEWEHLGGIGTAIAFTADRYVSGDPGVRFMPRTELNDLIGRVLPGWHVINESRIPPRRANLLLMLRRTTD